MNKIYAGILATFAIAILGFGMVSAFGGFGKGMLNSDLSEEEQIEMQEFHEAVQTSIENDDFESWKFLMESKINEEHFEKVKERHQIKEEFRIAMEEARETGDFSTVEGLKEQYGFQGPFERGAKMGFKFGKSCGCDLE